MAIFRQFSAMHGGIITLRQDDEKEGGTITLTVEAPDNPQDPTSFTTKVSVMVSPETAVMLGRALWGK